MWTPPVPADFKSYFQRDFPYAPEHDANNPKYITNVDIDKAIAEALFNFNSGLVGGTQATMMFMYLAAHYLVTNIRMSSKGLDSQAEQMIQSKSAGGVSVGYQIPEKIAKSPILAQYLTTGYGQKYLELAMKYIVGRVSNVEGTTTVY
jgi:hypothetical protein